MKPMIFVILCLVVAVTADQCHEDLLPCFDNRVNELINDQIGVELQGHYTYLYLSHFYQQHNYYYPKAAKYFRAKADEEMQHAEKFIDYQNQRGGQHNIRTVMKKSNGSCQTITSLLDGFKCAKELELEVTRALTNLLAQVSDVKADFSNCGELADHSKDLLLGQSIIVTANAGTKAFHSHDCSDIGDKTNAANLIQKVEYVELAEMIAHDFLGHQLEDTKELANYVSILQSFGSQNENLGSFLADKNFEF